MRSASNLSGLAIGNSLIVLLVTLWCSGDVEGIAWEGIRRGGDTSSLPPLNTPLPLNIMAMDPALAYSQPRPSLYHT